MTTLKRPAIQQRCLVCMVLTGDKTALKPRAQRQSSLGPWLFPATDVQQLDDEMAS